MLSFPKSSFYSCGAAQFPCSKSYCCGIMELKKKKKICCWWNISCVVMVVIRGEQGLSSSFFIPAKSLWCCPTEDQLCRKGSDVLSKLRFLLWIFYWKNTGGRELVYGFEGQDMVRNHMRNVRFCTEKDGPILKELCSQCAHLAKRASKDLEALVFKGGGDTTHKRWDGREGRLLYE